MLSLLLALVACTPDGGDSTRLEAFSASDGTSSWDETAYTGATTVTGQGRDWSLAVAADDGTTSTVTVHTPGESDLSSLSGMALTTTLASVWGTNPRDVEIDTVAGDEPAAPRFLAQIYDHGVATDQFGEDFVAYGDVVGTGTITDEYGDYTVEYHAVTFQTDDGTVTAEAGVPVELTIDGQSWRVVVHAAFQVTEYPEALPGCGGGVSDTLSFELLYEPPSPVFDTLSPLGDALAGEYSCE